MQAGPSASDNQGRTLQVYEEISGPTAFVSGRDADMVPSMVGSGEIGTYLVPEGQDPMAPASLAVRKVLFTIEGLGGNQIEAARSAIARLVAAGQLVKREDVARTIALRDCMRPFDKR